MSRGAIKKPGPTAGERTGRKRGAAKDAGREGGDWRLGGSSPAIGPEAFCFEHPVFFVHAMSLSLAACGGQWFIYSQVPPQPWHRAEGAGARAQIHKCARTRFVHFVVKDSTV